MGPAVEQRFLALAKAVRRANPWRIAAIFLSLLLLLAFRSSAPSADSGDLARRLAQLTSEVEELKQGISMPVEILNRHRESICYIYGEYSFSGGTLPGQALPSPIRFSGTGFVVQEGWIATNRHVAEPWSEDAEAETLMRHGAQPHLEKLVAFFPNHPDPVELTRATVAPDADIAVVRFDPRRAGDLKPLPLTQHPGVPGDAVVVVGYPMGITAMVAKSPRSVYRRLAFRRADLNVARELAALSLIRPSATQGHLGDVVGDKLIYDAVTAHGGSGGPVFNYQGLVIGVNTAYLDGFSGSTLGVSVSALRPVIEKAMRER